MNDSSFVDFYAAAKDQCLRAVLVAGLPSGEAEDALAEAFARAWASWGSLQRHPAPKAWVVRTALNAQISWWRRRRREFPHATPPEAITEPQATPWRLPPVIANLPARQREVLALRLLLGLSTAETATCLGIAPGTVTAHLHRALSTLRAHPSIREEILS